jgi:acetyltransferase-like isoleucine patch superfamily enzyme
MALDPSDHAFASGPVFRRPAGLINAIRQTGTIAHGQRLLTVWRVFAAGGTIGENVRLGLAARLINLAPSSRLSIGNYAMIRGILRVEAGGRLEIGDEVYIGDGVIISAAAEVTIGRGTFLAHGVQVFDNDTHPLDPVERQNHLDRIIGGRVHKPYSIPSAPVRIGKGCWIGMNSLVMKGVTIGDGSIIAAGSIVVKNVEPGTIAAGNPARTIKAVS